MLQRKSKKKLKRLKSKRMTNTKPSRYEKPRGKYFGKYDDSDNSNNGTKKLTRLQARMVEEYVKDFNGHRAYKAAGGKATGAAGRASAAQILIRPNVQAAIRMKQKEMREQSGVEAIEVVRELMRIGFADMKDFAKWSSGTVTLTPSEELDPSLSSAVQEVSESVSRVGISTVKVKLHPKIQALKMLGEHLNLFGKEAPDDETVEDKAQKIRMAVNDIFASVPTAPPKVVKKVVKLKGGENGKA